MTLTDFKCQFLEWRDDKPMLCSMFLRQLVKDGTPTVCERYAVDTLYLYDQSFYLCSKHFEPVRAWVLQNGGFL